MNLRIAAVVAAVAIASVPAFCKSKPVQDCKVSFSVVYLDRLNNTNYGIPAKSLGNIQKKLSSYGDVCYSTEKTADLVFFIHTTPAIYHGTHVYTNNSTSAAAASSSDGSVAAAAASSSSTTAVPYSVDYSVFILDIEKQQPDGSFRIVRTLDQKGLYNTLYGIGYGKGKHPIPNVIEAAARWLHENNFGQ
jgi:hypothetical protein